MSDGHTEAAQGRLPPLSDAEVAAIRSPATERGKREGYARGKEILAELGNEQRLSQANSKKHITDFDAGYWDGYSIGLANAKRDFATTSFAMAF